MTSQNEVIKTIFEMVHENKIEAAQELLEKHQIDINTLYEGVRLLDIAAAKNQLGFVKWLLARGADPELPDDEYGYDTLWGLAEGQDLVNKTVLEEIVVHCASKNKWIDREVDNTTATIVNKLITTLLYKAKRYNWDTYPCTAIRECIGLLDKNFKDGKYQVSPKEFLEKRRKLSKQQKHLRRTPEYSHPFENYIEEQETRNKTFYGSYLSSDSDSDEEQNLPILKQKKPFYRSYLFVEPSANYKLILRSQNNKTATNQQQMAIQDNNLLLDSSNEAAKPIRDDLEFLNKQLTVGQPIAEIIKQLPNKTQFFIAQYRGITYLTSRWNQKSRRLHRKLIEEGMPQFSHAVYKAAGLNEFKDFHNHCCEKTQAKLLEHAKLLKEILLTFREEQEYSYNGIVFNSLADLLQQLYSADYAAFHDLINSNPLLKSILPNHANFNLSTGDYPGHALGYAYGIKPYDGYEDDRLRPRWRANGRAERSKSGKVYCSIHPLEDFGTEGPNHLTSLLWDARIFLLTIISAERESTFPAYLPEGRVFVEHIAKYPSFHGNYKLLYFTKYGLTRSDYDRLKEKFLVAEPHKSSMTNFKKELGEWLCHYFQTLLIERARLKAQELGGVLIYRGERGDFSLTPPKVENPTQSSVAKEQRELINNTKKIRQALAGEKSKRIQIVDTRKQRDKVQKQKKIGDYHDSFLAEDEYDDSTKSAELSVELSLLFNTVKYQRLLALGYFLTKPQMQKALNFPMRYLAEDESCGFIDAKLLHISVICQNYKVLPTLLACKALEVNAVTDENTTRDWHGNNVYYEKLTALHLACMNDDVEAVKLLLQHPKINKEASANSVYNKDYIDNIYDWSATENLIEDEGLIGVFKYRGDYCQVYHVKQLTPLHIAATFDSVKVMRVLIQNGANVDAQTSDRQTALKIAEQLEHQQCIELLKNAEEIRQQAIVEMELIKPMAKINLAEAQIDSSSQNISTIPSILESSKPILKKSARRIDTTLGDGNCAFNSAALGLCKLCEFYQLDENQPGVKTILNELRSELSLTDASVAAFNAWLNNNQDADDRQRQLAPVLRKVTINFIKQHYNEQFKEVYEQGLLAAFNSYRNAGQEDETFMVHEHVKKKFENPNIDEAELLNWWDKAGHEQYFTNLAQPARDVLDRERWGSEVELNALALQLGINIIFENRGNKAYLGIGRGIINDLTKEEQRLLCNLEVGANELGTVKINYRLSLADIKARLQPITGDLRSKVIAQLNQAKIGGHRYCLLDDLTSQELIILEQRNIITKNSDGNHLFVGDDVKVDEKRIIASLNGADEGLLEKVIQSYKQDVAHFTIQREGEHWSFLLFESADLTLERDKINGKQLTNLSMFKTPTKIGNDQERYTPSPQPESRPS